MKGIRFGGKIREKREKGENVNSKSNEYLPENQFVWVLLSIMRCDSWATVFSRLQFDAATHPEIIVIEFAEQQL